MLAYGNFITILINFVILAFIIFIMVKQVNRMKKAEVSAPVAPPPTPDDILLLREIRDSLKNRTFNWFFNQQYYKKSQQHNCWLFEFIGYVNDDALES